MSRRERRAMLREYRRQWRDGWRGSPRELQLAGDSGDPPLDLDVLAFRRQLARSTTAIGICWAINLATTRYPWAIFPTIGIGAGLAGRLSSLWARGVSWERIFGPGRLGVQPPGSKLEQLVRRFRRRVRWILSGLGIAAVSFVFGVSHVLDGIGIGAGVGILGFLAGGATAVANTVGALLMVGPLRRRGVGVLGALSDDWRELAAADASPGATSDRRAAGTEREALPAAAPHPAVRLVPPEVLAGPYGDAVRRAADDRETIRGIIARLAPADRELLPEVEPTVDALVERVASLAPTLHRLDADLSPELLASTASRIDTVRSEPENAERDRRLALLERQQTTLRDLTERRRVLAGQLESAGLALRNLRLDLLRLRSSGVQATLGDLNNATQEARALSRDIAHVLGAADELRKL